MLSHMPARLILAIAVLAMLGLSGCSDPDPRLKGRWVGSIWEDGKLQSASTPAEAEFGDFSFRFDTGMDVVWYGTYETIRGARPSQLIVTLNSIDSNGTNYVLDPPLKRVGAYRFKSVFFNRTLVWNPLETVAAGLSTRTGPVFWGDKVSAKGWVDMAEAVADLLLLNPDAGVEAEP